jgi:hypothetical protein
MARIRLALFIFPVLLAPVSAADVSGSWKMSFKADWTRIPDLVCTLSQNDQRLQGTCKAAESRAEEKVDFNDGRIEADQVSWTWKIVVPDGVTWTYAFTGTLDANGTAMKGVVKLSAGSGAKANEVSFTAKKE